MCVFVVHRRSKRLRQLRSTEAVEKTCFELLDKTEKT